MDRVLKFDTSLLNQGSQSFEVYYSASMNLYNKDHECALISLSTYNCWHNVSSVYENNIFRYFNGTVWNDIVIPNGNYNLAQIEKAIHDGFETYGDFTSDPLTGKKSYSINFQPNYSTTKLYIELLNGFQIDFTASKINELLGFSSSIITLSQYGSSVVNITNGLEEIQVHCSLTSGSIMKNGSYSDVLLSFIPMAPPSGHIYIHPETPLYLAMSENNSIREIKFSFTDQKGNPISMNSPILLDLHIKPRMRI